MPSLMLTQNARAVLRGLLLLVPFLLIFGVLLAKADAQFEGLARMLVDWDTHALLLHVFWIVGFAWIATGYLRQQFENENEAPEKVIVYSRPFTIGAIEASVVLIGLNILFL